MKTLKSLDILCDELVKYDVPANIFCLYGDSDLQAEMFAEINSAFGEGHHILRYRNQFGVVVNTTQSFNGVRYYVINVQDLEQSDYLGDDVFDTETDPNKIYTAWDEVPNWED